MVKIHGAMVPVAARVEKIDSMSAHADAREMTDWLRTCPTPPSRTFLVHGEQHAQEALKRRIEATFGWTVHIPQHGEKVEVPL
jgi:metallo-beta-lactamase family protein